MGGGMSDGDYYIIKKRNKEIYVNQRGSLTIHFDKARLFKTRISAIQFMEKHSFGLDQYKIITI